MAFADPREIATITESNRGYDLPVNRIRSYEEQRTSGAVSHSACG